MKNIKKYIADLNDMGVKIWAEGDRLRYKVPKAHESNRASIRSQLAIRKAEIIEYLNQNQVFGSHLEPIPLLSSDQAPVPSLAQQRLWFLSQLEGQNAIYNIVSVYRLKGRLDEAAFRLAVTTLVHRHDSLRLCFPTVDGEPRVEQCADFDPLTVTDPGVLSKTRRPSAIAQWIDTHSQKPFDLAVGPLFRVSLLKLGEHEQILLFNMHHIISDAWSIGVLVGEWSRLYNAYTQNLLSPLPEQPIGYIDYAAWKQSWLQGEVLERQLAYWIKKLDNIPQLLEFPTDYPRPARMRYRGKRLIQSLSSNLTRKIKALGRRHGVTDFMTLLSAFNLLLYRYTGQTDIVVGSPIANRTHHQTEQLIGLLANTLAYRLKIDNTMTFSELLHQVKQTALEAYQHQDIPFEYLVEKLNPTRSMSHSPVYQVMFMLQNVPETELALKDLESTHLLPDHLTARLDLTLEIVEDTGGFSCGWEYNTDLFRPETIDRMARHFQVLLEGAVHDFDRPIARLPLLTRAETQQWLVWNKTQENYPHDLTLVDLFEHQVEKTPGNTAVVFKGQTLSYVELNQAGNQLARHLMTLGVTRGTLVGICVERSFDMVIGLLGILKAGGVYIPLDPEYPIGRLQDIFEDSLFPVLVSQGHLLERFSALPEKIVCLDNESKRILTHSPKNIVRQSGPAGLAYVIYTSGSTGRPKGVMIGHRALVNFLTSMLQAIEFTSTDRLLALTTISFDIAALELFLPLIAGGRTVVISRDTAASGTGLIQAMTENRISHMQATPATWELLTQSGWRQSTPLTILTGGEALPARLGQALLKNSRQLWNVYGPTETTIWSSIHNAGQHPEKPELIGTPIANTKIFILDANHSPTPFGVPGELCIGGHGLAMGYLNRPDLTADRFVEIDIFGERQRLYKTGDLARLRLDGNLEYLGRMDHQIKLRGFRIELGEIETVLGRHQAVKEAVVILDKGENPRLVAYVTPAAPIKQNSVLRAWLQDRLPEYMVPAIFIVLDRLPLTPNGKIDRKALPTPRRTASNSPNAAPRTDTEKRLVQVWRQVLKQPDIGIFDNFFEQGGDSILSVQIVAKARANGLELSPRDLFLHQTIAELARVAVTAYGHTPSDLPWAAPDQLQLDLLIKRYGDNIQEIYPLSPMQQGMLFHSLKDPGTGIYFEQFHCRLEGQLDIQAFQLAWQHLVDRHTTLRTAFCHDLGAPFQLVLKTAQLPWQTLDWRDLSKTEYRLCLQKLLAEQRSQGFDFNQPPLMRLQLIQEKDETALLVWNHHHLLMDGWCFPILFTELFEVYTAIAGDRPACLPKLPPYRSYIAWLHHQDRGLAKTYWQTHLQGFCSPTPLPMNRHHQGQKIFKEVSLSIESDLSTELNRFGRDHRLTLNTLVQGAWAALLSRYSGDRLHVVFGVTTSGRQVPITGIDRMVGLFINTLPLRVKLENQSILDVLQTIQSDQQLNNQYAYTALLDIQNWSEVPNGTPLFETILVFENYPVDERLKNVQFTGSLEIADFGGTEHTNYPITLAVIPKEALEFRLTYDSQRFAPEQMEALLMHLGRLLKGMVAQPKGNWFQLPLITDAEQQQLFSWNQTRINYPKEKTIVDLFQAQAEKSPDNTAVVFEDKVLGYGALNEKANQLARYLKKMGVGCETLVGICMDRSPEMVIGLLGILKSGGAYVPLDPDYPNSRLGFMLEDSAAPVLVSKSRFLKKLSPAQATILCLDRDWEKIAACSSKDFICPSGPSNLAYVIYTSGSTGRPKGVMVEHQSLTNLVHWHLRQFDITPQDRATLLASTAFDAAGWELWPYLCAGASVFPLKAQTVLAPGSVFKQWLAKQQISVTFLPTALLENLLSEPWQTQTLRIVLTGGDVLHIYPPPSCNFKLYNNYGPTENTVVTTSGVVPQASPSILAGYPGIGSPIANTQIHIISSHADCDRPPLTPCSLPGELCIAGHGLARGYLNRPELTAEKFIQIEIQGKKQRIYRTGDAARRHPDGTIEYLGRLDQQISLRGFRIELSEIEINLRGHKAVKDAVVVLHEENEKKTRHKQLIAYITRRGEPDDALTKDLKPWLKSRLPDYMIPTHILVLDKLPLTPNGKIDRKALPAPELSTVSVTYEAPRTHAEQRLLKVWQEVLSQPAIGIFDNFFEQGGDSILSIQIVARAQAQGLDLSPRDLFEHQTIAQLAQVAVPAADKKNAEQGPVTGELPLAPIQQRFFATQLKTPSHFNQAVLLKVPGDIDAPALEAALHKILSHHDALRLRYRNGTKGWTGRHAGEQEPAWHVEELDHLRSKDEQERVMAERADFWHTGFNLEKGPMVRMVLFRLGNQSRLLWCIHHLVVDGISWRILLEDLKSGYQQALDKESICLPDKTCSYKTWTQSLMEWTVRDADYWRRLPGATALPTDFSDSPDRVLDSQHHTIHLSKETTRRLLTEVPAAFRTQINDILLTALILTLKEWTGQLGWLIDLESHGRADLFEKIDFSRTVGWFTSLYTLFLQLPPESDLGIALKSIKEQLRQVPDHGVGYGVLRWLRRENLPQGHILFNYLGQFDPYPKDSNWQIAPEETGCGTIVQKKHDYLIKINGRTIDGCLSLTWEYSSSHYQKTTIVKLGDRYRHHLTCLVEHCSAEYGYTPSDFPLADLTPARLDRLTQRYGNDIADIYPLSPMQQGMLFHSVHTPQGGIYFEQFHGLLKGQLNHEAFESAWQHLILRHPILRTAFCHDMGAPFQVVLKSAQLSLQSLDWSDAENKPSTRLQELLLSQRSRGFDLGQAPLMRLQLIDQGNETFRLVLHHHHLLLDGWCLPILFTELFEAYTAIDKGLQPHLPPVPPYRTYIAWLSRQDREAAKAYWQSYLGGFCAPTPLPGCSDRQKKGNYNVLAITLNADLSRGLKRFSRTHRLTLNTLFQGAWAGLLSRYSGKEDVVFGVTTSGRQIPITGIEEMVGLFINTLPLRVKTRNQSIASLLKTIQKQQQKSSQYAYTALSDIQNWSEIPNGTSLFETILVFENYPVNEKLREKKHTGSLELIGFQGIEYTNYPLSLAIIPSDTIHLKLTYDNRRFEKTYVEGLMSHLSHLMAGMTAHPDQLWSGLPVLTKAEQHRLQAWNQTRTDTSGELTVVDLFQIQAEKNPENTAVVFEGQSLDYKALNRASNQLAHHLTARGVGSEILVGICMDRSLEMVIGLLGTLKAGGAYVPLDPGYPQSRLEFMLEDSNLTVLLTQSHLVDRLRVSNKIQVIALDSEWEEVVTRKRQNPVRQSKPGNLAYTIYTSGSTGKPKGVMVEHGALLNHMLWMEKAFSFTAKDKFLQKTPFSFDASVWEFYAPLLTGGTLVIARPGGHQDPGYLLHTVRDQHITVLQLVPAALGMLLEHPDFQTPTPLRDLFCGGESLSHGLVCAFHNAHPQTRLFNLYGPTETTIDATYFLCDPNRSKIAIGRPIANTRVYILDRNHNPLPLGAPGELCIAGDGLARGYLNSPQQTAKKFIEIKIFGKRQRIYKTGDLARWGLDGNLEYLGRLDHQVKLRGVRIELPEIETTLSQNEAVKEAVVILYGTDTPRLAAYVTPATSQKAVTATLRAWLKKRLPEFMVPTSFTVLDQLPLTPNGKIDRKALPAPELTAFTRTYAPPRTDTEHHLLQVWRRVLNQPGIGIFDNFFELGGDSILSIQIVAKARDKEMGLNPRDLFDHQTVAELAQQVRPLTRNKAAEQRVITGNLRLSPIQHRFFARRPDTPQHHNQAILLTLPGDVNKAALGQALAAILEHHDALRLRFSKSNGQWAGWFDTPCIEKLPWHIEDFTHLTSKASQDQALAERADFWQSNLNLEKGPLVRLVLFCFGNRARLLWCIHHLAVDGVSWRILLDDLGKAYQQAVGGKTIRLPDKTSSYKAWTERLLHLKNIVMHNGKASEYWRCLPQASAIPMDHPDGRNRIIDSRHHTIGLTPAMTQRLLTEAPAAYRTRINDLLLTALVLTLQEWTGQPGSLIDIEGHGREDLFDDIDLSRTVGWFTAIHTLALDLPLKPDPGLALKSIKEQLRKIPQGGLGYGIARWLCHESLPQGQILFNYLGQFEQGLDQTQWQFARENSGQAIGLQEKRDYLIEINGQTINGSFSLTWSYSGRQYRSATIKSLTDRYQQHLEGLIEHCAVARGYTPSDFPLAALTQDQLDLLPQRFGDTIADIYPLSPMQQGMLFHNLETPEQGIYFEQRHCLFKGRLDVQAFGSAWQHLIDRHTILRTAICHDLDTPFQLVLNTAKLPWQTLDWRNLPETQCRQQLDDLLAAERSLGFDLNQAPLMRLQLIRESDMTWRMVWHHHHMLMDGWSLPILFTELLTAYAAISKGASPLLPPVRPYQAYIAWLSQQDREKAKAYWQAYLKGFSMPTPLPVGQYSRKTADHSALPLGLTTDLSQKLTRFSRKHRLTLNTLVQGAWAAVLSRYTGEEDIVFGATTSGRQVPISGIDRMMGIFINTLPLRVKLKNAPMSDILKKIQQDQQQNNQYGHTALSDIQSWSDVSNGIALFETIVVFENYPMDQNLEVNPINGGLEIDEAQGVEYTNYPITLAVIPGNTLDFKLTYNSHRFEKNAMKRLLVHFNRLLEKMVAHPDLTCRQLPLLSRAEQALQLSWNKTRTVEKETIVDLFQSQVEKIPNTIAVVYEEQVLSYGQLNTKANRLAHYLRSRGVGCDTLVGICMDRSLEMIIGLLGILKAGGAYVPLDPDYPAARLAFMLADAGVTMVLSQDHLQKRLPAQKEYEVICPDKKGFLAAFSGQNPPGQSRPENLAYVIYTSGSTGKPKGCQVTQSNVTRLFGATQETFHFDQNDVWTLFHSFAFDFSVWEIWGALLHGGRLVITPYFTSRTPEAFYQLLIDQKVTILNQTPSAFTQLNRVDSRPGELSLRTVIFGGEALDFSVLDSWYTRHDDTRPQLVNMYGITETTVHVTSYPLTVKDGHRKNIIGSPIADLEAWVLDKNLQPVPEGVQGELHIAGAGLARGYLNRPELTAEKFIEIPVFGNLKRLYKTGDLACRRSDGNLEYRGRIDHQIKLRGFRIELSEIEAALKQHKSVYQAIVVLCNSDDTPRLAAYVTLQSQDPSGRDEVPASLRDWLKTQLPDHMVPAGITVLDQLPLTPNGKIDQKSLPIPDFPRFTQTYEAPRTDTEQRLLAVWRQVLKQEDMGIYDNFFEQGGDSILSIQIVAKARARGLELTPKDLFQYQTVDQLAQVVGSPANKKRAEQGTISGEIPLTPIQQWFFTVQRSQPAHFNQAVLLKVPKDINELALKQGFRKVLGHHDALRLRYRKNAGHWIGCHDGEQRLPWHIEDLGHLDSGEVQSRTLAKRADFWQTGFNLETGPLMRLVLFHLGNQSRLLWCIHHLIVDGVSWRILLEDLHNAYTQAAEGKTIRLPDKTSSYKAWATQLIGWKNKSGNENENAYWQSLPNAVPLPVDHPAGRNRIIDARHHRICLTPAMTRRLLTRAPAAYHTQINDLLLTALMLTLQEWTGRCNNLIDLESHGRADLDQDLDLSRTVGWFTSLYTQHLCLPEKTDPETALKGIKEQLRKIPHEGIGYGIARWLCHENLPQGQILFNYLGQFDQVLSDTDWQLAPEESGRPSGLQEERDYLIEINGRTLDGCFNLTWTYSNKQYKASTIEKLGDRYRQHLEQIIDHCDTARGYTPSDFPLAGLNQRQLDILTQKYAHNVQDIYPLSPMQQGMLFHSLGDPAGGMYFEQIHCRIKGSLDIENFHQAWQHMVDRHTLLHTAFCHDLDTPVQVVVKTAKLPWQTMDWRDMSKDECQNRLDDLLTAERSRGVDLDQAPLMRLQMIREDEATWRMVWHHHHLLLDGWSLPILFAELFESYTALAKGLVPQLPQTRPYLAYITWLGQQDHKMAKAYWQSYLAGFSAPTPLPIGQSHQGTGKYQTVTLRLEKEVTRQVTGFSRKHRLTLNTLVQGAWATLLSRYSGETDVTFGVTTSGRQVPITGIDRMVGLFINTLPLRINLSSHPVLSVLQRIQKEHQQNCQYAYTCLADIQNLSEVPNGIPLFETILVFENYPVNEELKEKQQLDSLKLVDFNGIEQTNYPITLAAIPGETLCFKLTYDPLRFKENEIKSLLAHLNRLMEGMVAHPEQTCSRLPLLTESEKHCLQSWNPTQITHPKEQTILDLFQAQVEQIPDSIAVIFGEERLTYQVLNNKANRLAHYLKTQGVGCETLVGICLDRSLEMVVGLLGILKAGGAYVPLDPDYPPSRLECMLEDLPVLLSRKHLLKKLTVKKNIQVFCLDRGWEKVTPHCRQNPIRQSKPENLAYVIYTSGSTGRPKGVMIEHGALLNHMQWMTQAFSFSKEDKFLQKTPFSFDASVWEFYAPLLTGATLVIARPGGHQDPGYLLDTIKEHQISVLQLVPTGLRMLLENIDFQPSPPLRCLFCGGERLTHDLARAFQNKFPRTRLFNLYGPTETTIDATYSLYDPSRFHVAIGRPIANTRIYILDRNHTPLPPGIPGELCIAGAGLARGYLNDPQRTAKQFMDIKLFGKRQRLYKTGDLARWGWDGNLEYLGRLDHQVKLRGFRIELQEIEITLKRHKAVGEAIVTIYHENKTARLIAYVTPKGNQPSGTALDQLPRTLGTWVRDRLPDYMVPVSFTVIDELPLTPSGKINPKALPVPAVQKASTPFLSPRNRTELILTQIWETLLKVSHIGIKDNFFELGGHSLLAVRLASRIKQKLKKQIPLSTLFQKPTIEALARLLHAAPQSGENTAFRSALITINGDGKKPPLFCVHPAGGTVFCYYELAQHLGKDQPVYGIQAFGIEAEQEPYTQMEKMAQIYIEAIKTVQPQGPYQLAGWSFGGQAAFEMAGQLQANGESVSLLAVLDSFMRSPSQAPPIPGDDAQLMFDLLTEQGIFLCLETLRQLTLDEQLIYVKEQGKQVDYFPLDIDLAELKRLFKVYKASLSASLTYTPHHAFHGKIILFKAIEQLTPSPFRPDLGWTDYATKGVEVIRVAGHHHNIAQSPHVQKLTEQLRVYLKN